MNETPATSDCAACRTGRGAHSCGLSGLQGKIRIGSGRENRHEWEQDPEKMPGYCKVCGHGRRHPWHRP